VVQPSKAPCPWCRAGPPTLFVAELGVAKPIGTWALAGMQTKHNVHFGPVLICRSCNRGRTGHHTDERHVDFARGFEVDLDPETVAAASANALPEDP
jgi:hypothetical protein